MKNTIKIRLSLAIIAMLAMFGGAYIYATPYIAASGLQSAIESGDKHEISDFVDFPALRESVKNQLNLHLTKSMAEKLEGNPFAALGGVLALGAINLFVDNAITPEGVAAMYRHGKFPTPEGISTPEENSTSEEQGNAADTGKQEPKYRLMYESLNRFAITLEKNGKTATFMLKRNGLFEAWKLVDIDFTNVLEDSE